MQGLTRMDAVGSWLVWARGRSYGAQVCSLQGSCARSCWSFQLHDVAAVMNVLLLRTHQKSWKRICQWETANKSKNLKKTKGIVGFINVKIPYQIVPGSLLLFLPSFFSSSRPSLIFFINSLRWMKLKNTSCVLPSGLDVPKHSGHIVHLWTQKGQ